MSTYKDIKYNLGALTNGSGEILLSTSTLSSDSNVQFTTGIDSTYKKYILRYLIHVSSDEDNLLWQGSTNGGSGYGVTTTSTYFRAYHQEDDGAAAFNVNNNADLAQSTNGISLGRSIGNDNDQIIVGYLCLFEPSDTTFVTHYLAKNSLSSGGTNNASYHTFSGGFFNTTSAINAVRFIMTNGNLDAGTIKLYGVKG